MPHHDVVNGVHGRSRKLCFWMNEVVLNNIFSMSAPKPYILGIYLQLIEIDGSLEQKTSHCFTSSPLFEHILCRGNIRFSHKSFYGKMLGAMAAPYRI